MTLVVPELIIEVPGKPVAWARAGRQIKTKKGQTFIQTYTPKHVDEWKSHVAQFAQMAATKAEWTKPERGVPLCVDEDFHYLRPSGYRKTDVWKYTRADRDNLDKAILDALQWAGVIADDGQVVDGRIRKFIDDEWNGVIIRIMEASATGLPIGAASEAMPRAQGEFSFV